MSILTHCSKWENLNQGKNLVHGGQHIFKKATVLVCLFVVIICFISTVPDYDYWKNARPSPVQIKTGSVYDYYDVFEELGT